MSQTLAEKVWERHVVHRADGEPDLLYVDLHLVHEVTSPQAFEGLDLAGRRVWRISANLAVSDHNVPTTDRSHGIADPVSRLQVDTLDATCDRFGITQFKMNDKRQGIVQRAIGIPVTLFTAIFALARTVGWIAQLNEMIADPEYKIGRPRQLYTGATQREVKAIDQRR